MSASSSPLIPQRTATSRMLTVARLLATFAPCAIRSRASQATNSFFTPARRAGSPAPTRHLTQAHPDPARNDEHDCGAQGSRSRTATAIIRAGLRTVQVSSQVPELFLTSGDLQVLRIGWSRVVVQGECSTTTVYFIAR